MSVRQSFDYTAQLRLEYEELRKRVRSGMLPLVARVPAIEKAVKTYVEALDGEFERKRAKAIAEGRSVNTVPIPYRDERLLHQLADLVMYEELTWSHPDKMSIVEYPVMSEWQAVGRRKSQPLNDDIQYGDRRGRGRRKTHFIDDYGAPQVRNNKMPYENDPDMDGVAISIVIGDLLDNAGLTARQRRAIDLIFVNDMTQKQAGAAMGVSDRAVRYFLDAGLTKIRRNLVGSTS